MGFLAANLARSQANANRLNAAIEGFSQRTSSAALFPPISSSVAVEAASPVVLELTILALIPRFGNVAWHAASVLR